MRGNLQVGSFYTGSQVCCHSHSLSLPDCGTKADFKGSSVRDPITSASLDYMVSFPMGQTAEWLSLCDILPRHLQMLPSLHTCLKTIFSEKTTEFPNSQAEFFFPLSNLPCPNVCFRNLTARLAQRQVPPPGFPHGAAPAYDWLLESDNTLWDPAVYFCVGNRKKWKSGK